MALKESRTQSTQRPLVTNLPCPGIAMTSNGTCGRGQDTLLHPRSHLLDAKAACYGLNLCPPKIYAEVLTSRTHECPY